MELIRDIFGNASSLISHLKNGILTPIVKKSIPEDIIFSDRQNKNLLGYRQKIKEQLQKREKFRANPESLNWRETYDFTHDGNVFYPDGILNS